MGDTSIEALAPDVQGDVYVTGDTSGGSLSTTSGAAQEIPRSYDFRLLGFDPDFPAVPRMIAHSEPVYVLPSLKLSSRIERPANIVHLRAEGLPAGTYDVQAADKLQPAVWEVVGAVVSTNGAAEFTELINFARTTRFYRLAK